MMTQCVCAFTVDKTNRTEKIKTGREMEGWLEKQMTEKTVENRRQ